MAETVFIPQKHPLEHSVYRPNENAEKTQEAHFENDFLKKLNCPVLSDFSIMFCLQSGNLVHPGRFSERAKIIEWDTEKSGFAPIGVLRQLQRTANHFHTELHLGRIIH